MRNSVPEKIVWNHSLSDATLSRLTLSLLEGVDFDNDTSTPTLLHISILQMVFIIQERSTPLIGSKRFSDLPGTWFQMGDIIMYYYTILSYIATLSLLVSSFVLEFKCKKCVGIQNRVCIEWYAFGG